MAVEGRPITTGWDGPITSRGPIAYLPHILFFLLLSVFAVLTPPPRSLPPLIGQLVFLPLFALCVLVASATFLTLVVTAFVSRHQFWSRFKTALPFAAPALAAVGILFSYVGARLYLGYLTPPSQSFADTVAHCLYFLLYCTAAMTARFLFLYLRPRLKTLFSGTSLMSHPQPPNETKLHPSSAAEIEARKRLRQSPVVRVLFWIIAVIVTVLWSVIGFLIWIPLLTRMTMLFTAAILTTMLTGRDPTDAERKLEFAIMFYARGFYLLRETFSGTTHHGQFDLPQPQHVGRLIIEIIFCLVFWGGIFLGWAAFTGRLIR